MKKKPTLQQMQKTYRSLAANLTDTGLLLQGTITERIIHKKSKQPGKGSITYGPYFQWTFKEEGKTRTVNLSKEQLYLFLQAIENNRKVEAVLKEMREMSREILEAATRGVKKRKPR